MNYGLNHHRWKGGSFDKQGRLYMSYFGVKKYDYVLKIESILGKELPKGVVVHHVDENHRNNKNSNLVVCENQAYHMLLHQRQRVVAAGGDPNTQAICGKCKEAKDIADFYLQKSGRKVGRTTSYCRSCVKLVDKSRTRRKQEAV